MSTNNSVPGMIYPTQKAMIGANPADSARQTAVNKAEIQTQANKLMAGGKIIKRRYRGGAVVVPQYQMLYEPQGGTGTNPNEQIQGNAQTSTQMAANAVYDSQATKMGGSRSRRRRRGGNPNWLWGCMSGGKKRTCKVNKRYRKNKKSRKHRKH
jgi:hypothetical protein